MADPTSIFIVDNGAYTIKANYSSYNDPHGAFTRLYEEPRPAKKKPGKKSRKKSSAVRPQADEVPAPPPDDPYEPRVIYNCLARAKDRKTYLGSEIDSIPDHSNLLFRRPFEKGLLTSWAPEHAIFNGLFEDFKVNPSETSLLITEPPLNPPNLGENYDQMVFEEWEFASYARSCAAALVPFGGLFETPGQPLPSSMVLIDAGYSFTHVTPIVRGKVVWSGIRRIDVGGKLLTNQLKRVLSFRQWDLTAETHIVNRIREQCCYVTTDWKKDMEVSRSPKSQNTIVQEYCLPDFTPYNPQGFIKSGPDAISPPERPVVNDPGLQNHMIVENDHVVRMNNERFSVPEIIFTPSDIGLQEAGLVDTVASVISSMDKNIQGMLWANIGLYGGLAQTEGLGERLDRDLRAVCPAEYEPGIFEAEDSIKPTYYAAHTLSLRPEYLSTYPISRSEYLEQGSIRIRRHFINNGLIADIGNENVVIQSSRTNEDSTKRKGKSRGKRRSLFEAAGSDDALSEEEEDSRLPARVSK